MKIVNNQLAWSRCVVTWLRMAQCTLVGKNSFEGGTVSKKKKEEKCSEDKNQVCRHKILHDSWDIFAVCSRVFSRSILNIMKIVDNQLAWSRCVVTWLQMAQRTLVGKNSFEGGTVYALRLKDCFQGESVFHLKFVCTCRTINRSRGKCYSGVFI